MQAKIHRSSRRRHRGISERNEGLRQSEILDERPYFDRALSQAGRVTHRIGAFVHDKYQSIVNFFYTKTPRFTGGRATQNKVMQAPIDDGLGF